MILIVVISIIFTLFEFQKRINIREMVNEFFKWNKKL